MKALIRQIQLPPAPEPTATIRAESNAVHMDDIYVAKHRAKIQGHHWAQAEIDEITQMRRKGMQWKEIAEEFGLGRETVRRAWTKSH